MFENVHNYDGNFATGIKVRSQSIKLVPRVYVEGSQTAFFQSIGSNRDNFRKTVSLIV